MLDLSVMLRLTIEAVVVGITALLIGLVVHVLFGYHAQHATSPRMKKEMMHLSITLFFTGFFVHLLFEGMGWNKSYCVMKMKGGK